MMDEGQEGEPGRGLRTVLDAARELRCSTETVLRRIRAGQIKAIREGGRFLVRAVDLAAYIESRKYKPGGKRR